MVSPGDTFLSYRELARYVAEQVDLEAELVLRPTYEEVNRLVLSGKVDVAFICTGAYADAAGDPGMLLLVAPIVAGSHQYYSDIIVPPGSPARSLEDLVGARFAYVDELSNSGRSAPRRRLEELGYDPASFFSESIFTGSHDRSIEAVAAGVVDGAAVDSLILDGLRAAKDPGALAVTVQERLGPFGMPPVVVSGRLAAPLREQLRRVFLGLGDTQRGREILAPLRIDGFRVPAPEEYEDLVEASRRGS
jgi:phosphonate transport system substrate-binding protein